MSACAALIAAAAALTDAGVVGVAVGVDDAQAVVVRGLHRALLHLERERVVGGGDRDRLGRRLALHGVLDDADEILARGRLHADRVAVALVEDALGGAAAVHHRHRVALGDGGGGERRRRAVRPEHEVDVLVGDHRLDEARRRLGLRLVVGVADLDVVRLRAGADAAVRVDVAHPEIVALFGELAFVRQRAAQRDRRAEHDRALGRGGGGLDRGRKHREGEQGAEACASIRVPFFGTKPSRETIACASSDRANAASSAAAPARAAESTVSATDERVAPVADRERARCRQRRERDHLRGHRGAERDEPDGAAAAGADDGAHDVGARREPAHAGADAAVREQRARERLRLVARVGGHDRDDAAGRLAELGPVGDRAAEDQPDVVLASGASAGSAG